ncbi:sigma-70 family RNA polymerase sigma factor [Sphingobium estronivorans]|uniref:sigma-70 family RNA polymerase sigma factor n=1 Tax=Sphingobium estronivorans TaxID=1577690 RepID=UPI0012391D84|nr:sigma-70 family RNA polymerase sigma factor [Sphingobium estronivorans]
MKASRDRSSPPLSSPGSFLPALRRFFQRRVPREHVEDLVQDVFVNLQARRAASPIENNEAYLFTVARHVLARHWKHGGRTAADGPMEDAEHVCDAAPLPDRRLLDKEALSQVLQAIETMPLRTRDIFLMHRFEDMTYSAIARQIGVSTSAVEKHIAAALRILIEATGRSR